MADYGCAVPENLTISPTCPIPHGKRWSRRVGDGASNPTRAGGGGVMSSGGKMQNTRERLDDARKRLSLDMEIYEGLRRIIEGQSGLHQQTKDQAMAVLNLAESNLRLSLRNFKDTAEGRAITT